jgi:tetratricopeptide (TPR) repeat protein
VTLRAAQALLQAEVPPRHIRRALREVERQLMPGQPLSAVRLYADGRRVLVRSQGTAWHAESGQTVFSFNPHTGKRESGVVVQVEGRHGRAAAVYWFTRALTLEDEDMSGAIGAYRRALELNPDLADAYLNLGRLVHEMGDTEEAIGLYEEAVHRIPDDPLAHYNLATALEDTGNVRAAMHHYHSAVDIDPEFADAHYNLGRLLDRVGQRKRALRHFLAYRRLMQSP